MARGKLVSSMAVAKLPHCGSAGSASEPDAASAGVFRAVVTVM